MEQTLNIKIGQREIKLSDLDNEGHVLITVASCDESADIYLNKCDLKKLAKHIQYLINKD